MTTAGAQVRFEVSSADGTLIPVYRSGSGRPLILVHGGVFDHTVWDRVRPLLETRASIYSVDRRSRVVDASVRYDLRREFEDIAAVAEAAGDEVDILGQSSGAVCALGASLLIPTLRRLVIYEPPLVSALPSHTERMEQLLKAGEMEGLAEAFLTHSVRLSPDAVAAMKDSRGWAKTVALAPFMVREEAVLRAWQPRPQDFRDLRAPVLFLTGQKTPQSHHHRGFIDLLTSAGVDLTVVEIPGQEHHAHRDAPAPFAQPVLDFLELPGRLMPKT